MGDVAKEGRTVLFVSHNMAAVTKLCNRAILLDAGSMITQGTPMEIVSTYIFKDRLAWRYDVEPNQHHRGVC
jgi:lipopolysaccharide transport system ATP-binding protein